MVECSTHNGNENDIYEFRLEYTYTEYTACASMNDYISIDENCMTANNNFHFHIFIAAKTIDSSESNLARLLNKIKENTIRPCTIELR